MRHRKSFIEQFPLVSAGFSTSAPSAAEFQAAVAQGKGSRLMSCWMLADDLMTSCASHREATDLFSRFGFASRRNLLTLELGIVPKKQEQTTKSSNGRAEWKGFLDCRLDDYHLSQLDAWHPKPTEIWTAVDALIQAGYRFTLSYNKNTKVATCTIIDDDETRKTGGNAIASADTDGANALKMAIYKHCIMLENSWDTLVDSPPPVRRG